MNEPAARYPHAAPIDAYGNGGFRFADMSHRGSILCLPSGIYAWEVSGAAEFTARSFARVFAEGAAVNTLLIGTGRTLIWPDRTLRLAFGEHAVVPEFMDTGAAARTYNILLAERRPVAAALIAVD